MGRSAALGMPPAREGVPPPGIFPPADSPIRDPPCHECLEVSAGTGRESWRKFEATRRSAPIPKTSLLLTVPEPPFERPGNRKFFRTTDSL